MCVRDDRGSVDAWYSQPVGAVTWDDTIGRLRRTGAGFDELRALRDELVALDELIEPPRQVQTCHRDLFADNVRTISGAASLCVIDWDDSGPADPNHELAVVLLEFGCGDKRRMRTLYDSYRDAGGPARITRTGDCKMLIAQLGH